MSFSGKQALTVGGMVGHAPTQRFGREEEARRSETLGRQTQTLPTAFCVAARRNTRKRSRKASL